MIEDTCRLEKTEEIESILNHKDIFNPGFYRKLVEDSTDGHLLFSAKTGRLLYLNMRSKDLLGYHNQNISNLRIWEFLLNEEKPLFKERLKARIGGKTLAPDRRIYNILKKDKSIFRAEIITSKMNYDDHIFIHCILRDISRHEKFIRQLEYIQRMETTATLTKRLVERFSNVVNEVKRNIRSLEEKSKKNIDLSNHISTLNGSMNFLTRSISKLNAFANGGETKPKVFDLNDMMNSIVSAIRMKIRPNINLHRIISDEKLKINADADQIQLVIYSIVTNSEEAIEKNGQIVISTSRELLTKETCPVDPEVMPGDYACISIKDNGIGMDEKTLNKLGEPFFTTKIQGRGLGFPAVYGIIKRHNGKLSIQSEPGKGTEVKIYLKIIDQIHFLTKRPYK